MNISLLYLISIMTVILVLSAGYFIAGQKSSIFNSFKSKQPKNVCTSTEIAECLIAKNQLININITSLNAKKTNYYSIKYNVIKLAPDVKEDTSLSSLATASYLSNQAKFGQRHTILYFIKLFFSFICKISSIIFFPSVLLCAIINASVKSSIPKTIILVLLTCYIISFIIQLIFLALEIDSTQVIKKDITNLQIFNESEIQDIHHLTKLLCLINFFNYTRLSLAFLQLLSLDNIYRQNA